jgi:small-conductance mechanosensitive channel
MNILGAVLRIVLVVAILGLFGVQTARFAALLAGAGVSIFQPTVEVLDFNERGPRIAVRPYAHTNHYSQVYFDTNRMIANVLGRNGFPTPRIPVAMASGAGVTAGSRPWDSAN